MVGSIGIAFWIAHGAFWLLIIIAAVVEQRIRLAAIFVALWLAGYAGSAWLTYASAWFLSYVACWISPSCCLCSRATSASHSPV